MTRINCVLPNELSRQHLIAEYRELPRAFGLIKAAQARKEPLGRPFIPSEYSMGAGHVRFFYDKAGWLLKRQSALVAEMKLRGYLVSHSDPHSLVVGITPSRMKDWSPRDEDLATNRVRIKERMSA